MDTADAGAARSNEAPPVRVHAEGDVVVVTLDRPDRANALDAEAARAVGEAIAQAHDARAIILTGTGKAFCAGGNLEELDRWSGLDAGEISSALYENFQGMIRAVRSTPAIVVAAINGAAVGAGCDLALACDLRVAGRSARLGQVWVGLGVIPGTGGAYLTQALAGPTRAAHMLLTGELVDAERALARGLVNSVVDDDRLMDEARAVAAAVLRHPRDGVIANKRAMTAATEDALEAALRHAAEVQPERFRSDEFKSALGARLRRS